MSTATTSGLGPNELWMIGIAAYAAIVSTFVLGWDAYKWLASGARIELTASTGMKLAGGGKLDSKTYISVTAMNVGDRPTTITNLGILYYTSWWSAYARKRHWAEAFIIPQPSESQRIPYRFEVGDQWIGLTDQEEEIIATEEMGTGRNGDRPPLISQ
jgi:hypothetical protein